MDNKDEFDLDFDIDIDEIPDEESQVEQSSDKENKETQTDTDNKKEGKEKKKKIIFKRKESKQSNTETKETQTADTPSKKPTKAEIKQQKQKKTKETNKSDTQSDKNQKSSIIDRIGGMSQKQFLIVLAGLVTVSAVGVGLFSLRPEKVGNDNAINKIELPTKKVVKKDDGTTVDADTKEGKELAKNGAETTEQADDTNALDVEIGTTQYNTGTEVTKESGDKIYVKDPVDRIVSNSTGVFMNDTLDVIKGLDMSQFKEAASVDGLFSLKGDNCDLKWSTGDSLNEVTITLRANLSNPNDNTLEIAEKLINSTSIYKNLQDSFNDIKSSINDIKISPDSVSQLTGTGDCTSYTIDVTGEINGSNVDDIATIVLESESGGFGDDNKFNDQFSAPETDYDEYDEEDDTDE